MPNALCKSKPWIVKKQQRHLSPGQIGDTLAGKWMTTQPKKPLWKSSSIVYISLLTGLNLKNVFSGGYFDNYLIQKNLL